MYIDVDFVGDKIVRKSFSVVILRINEMIVVWHCKKQTAVAPSTAEAKHFAASGGGKELLGFRIGWGLRPSSYTPMRINMDNEAAINQVKTKPAEAGRSMWMCARYLWAITTLKVLFDRPK